MGGAFLLALSFYVRDGLMTDDEAVSVWRALWGAPEPPTAVSADADIRKALADIRTARARLYGEGQTAESTWADSLSRRVVTPDDKSNAKRWSLAVAPDTKVSVDPFLHTASQRTSVLGGCPIHPACSQQTAKVRESGSVPDGAPNPEAAV